MTIRSGSARAPITLLNEKPKNPWGGGGSGGSGGDGGRNNGGGPRNPWQLPPGGRPRGTKPTALDDFIRRARGGGGGLPSAPGGRSLWLIAIGIVVAAWLILTSFHVVAPQERGVVTFFGRYSGTLEPGYHVTLPAPINDVVTIDVQNIRNEDFPDGGGENLMLTGDRNIIDLAYSVRWNVANPQDFAFQIADPRSTVRATAESAMREVIANVTLDDAMGPGRTLIEQRVQDRMQQILDGYRSGVQIQGVAVKQADPPAAVNEAFKDVTAAQQDAVTAQNQAQAYAQQMIAKAEGDAAQFDKLYAQYKLAPEVTRRRMYYETMENVLSNVDKTVVEGKTVPYLAIPPMAPAANLGDTDQTGTQATPTAVAPTGDQP